MDATCNVQDSIHVFHLVHNMCPGFWVHIISGGVLTIKNISDSGRSNSDTFINFIKFAKFKKIK